MPGQNLTRDEARERARIIDVEEYHVELDLRGDDRTFRSASTIVFRCHEPGAETFVDLIAPLVHEVTLNGRHLDPASVFDGTRVSVSGLEADNELTVVADCEYSRTGEGLHRFVDPVDDAVYLYTQFEPADARRMYANFEQPNLKARFTLTVIAPADWHVVSNTATPTPEPVAGASASTAVARWRFAPTPPISTYITALVAGPYHLERDCYRRTLPDGTVLEIPMSVMCRASLSSYLDAEALFTITKQGLDFFHDNFDYPYPFGSYDQAFVPEYNLGAMENPGCVTFTEDFVFRSKVTDAAYEGRANVILHEMTHMWFGDLVTMDWWDDLWLKESFADYMGALSQVEATRWPDAWVTFANQRKNGAYRQDQMPSTHPIVADVTDLEMAKLNFDGITYAKGGAVLKQLVAYVGRDAFMAGVQRYFARHAYGNTTLRDLLAALEEASERADLSVWSKAWLQTSGVNRLVPDIAVDEHGIVTGCAILQETDGDPELGTVDAEPRPHRLVLGCYQAEPEGVRRTRRLELDVVGARTEVPELIGQRRPDLLLLNDDDLTYGITRFDEGSISVLRDRLAEIPYPLSRAVCWSALWNMTRDALLPARDFVELVSRFAARESNIGLVQSLQAQLGVALDQFVVPEHRDEASRAAAVAARQAMRTAAPGGDHQLAWTRCLARIATAREDLDLLEALLRGDEQLDGLTLDQDLRWELLIPLVTHGVATDDDIEAELRRDDTAAGRRRAQRCRAARSTADAKQWAWHATVETQDVPNNLLEELIWGFRQTPDRELLAPYVDRYFKVLDDVWQNRTIESSRRLVMFLYPTYLPRAEVIERTDSWLASGDHAPALRRLVLEGRAELVRALRARERDRSASSDLGG